MMIFLVLILSFCAAYTPNGWADTASVVVNVSQDKIDPQEELSLSAGVDGSMDQDVDLYLGLSIPGITDFFYLGTDLGFYNDPIPILSNWKPSKVPVIKLFTHTFTGQEPQGEYFWYGGMFYPGSPLTSENLLSDISYVGFSFSADGIVDYFPKAGTVVQTEEPDLFLLFSRPPNKDSVLEHIEIKLRSLDSGKTAEVKWINGERFLVVDIPDCCIIEEKISENEYIDLMWTEDDRKITFHVGSYTKYGVTFSLHKGGSYESTFRLLHGAFFADGDPIPSKVIGPISFSVAK